MLKTLRGFEPDDFSDDLDKEWQKLLKEDFKLPTFGLPQLDTEIPELPDPFKDLDIDIK